MKPKTFVFKLWKSSETEKEKNFNQKKNYHLNHIYSKIQKRKAEN